jgi:acyl-CoA reductase-like NAD-dependent aldehyde dehydrogenase
VRRWNFTGSTATGRKLAGGGSAPQACRPELGAANPLLVLADADLDYAVDAAAFGAFLHQGQICMSSHHRRAADRQRVLGRLVTKVPAQGGRRKQPDTIIGPSSTSRRWRA